MAITFLDEEEDIVATAEPQKGKSRITFLDEEEPVETPSAERPKITFLDEGPTPAQPAPPVGTSFFEEVAAIPQAFIQGIDQPTEAMAETATVLGMPALGETLRGAVEGAEGYVPAAQRFMQPQEGEFQIGGFAPQFLPRAIVEQAGQIAGAIATRAAGGAIGGLAGSAVGPKGTVAGAVAGQFLGPALFEMSQVVGPVARERAANQGRETPNGDDLGWAWATAGASGALNAIGARYLPNGDKLAGGLAKRISQAFIGEGIPEGGQAAVQQIGETFLTEQGLDLRPKEIAGEALIGGGAGAAAVGVAAPFTKASTAAETKVVAEQAAPVAPETAQVVSEQANQVIAQAQAEETAETPDERVARLQREAQEAAGDIELEEEGVSGLPPVEPTPPVTPTPEAAVAPVESVVPAEGARPPVTPEVVPKAENAVVEAEQKSEQESDTVKVFRGVAEAGALPTGGAFFTDSERDASAYAQLAALRKAVEENEDFNDIVSEVMAEEGANDITDLSINTIKSIIEGNNIQVGDISEGAVLRGNIRLGNVLNLESFGSEVGSLPETWNELNELGLVPETWESLDEDVQEELSDKYRGKAFYSLLEGEVNLNDQFAKGIDTIVFTDQNTEGKGTHRTYLTKAAEQFAQEAAPAAVEPTPVAPPVTPEAPKAEETIIYRPAGKDDPVATLAERLISDEQEFSMQSGGVVDAYRLRQNPRLIVEDVGRGNVLVYTPEKSKIGRKKAEEIRSLNDQYKDVQSVRYEEDYHRNLGKILEYNPKDIESFITKIRQGVPTPEVREARREPAITPQQDRDYLDAVERGDLDAASRVVEDAATKAGFTKKVFRGQRKKGIRVMWDRGGTFTAFDVDRARTYADPYGETLTLLAKEGKTLDMSTPSQAYSKGGLAKDIVDSAFVDNLEGEINRFTGEPWTIQDALDAMDAGLAWDVEGTGSMRFWKSIIRYAENSGLDSLSIMDGGDFGNGVSFVIFNNNNLKLADPVTRDDQGNIIPLSKRFQPEQADIRYARTERDPEVQKAAQDLRAGTIGRDEYQRIVDMRMPLRKFEAVPIPATNDDMLRGLGERKAGERLKKDLIQNPESIAEGTVLEARLDIPAYESENVWVVSLHRPRPDLQRGAAAEVVAYTPTSVLRNVTFGVTEKAAAGIAAGKPKSTIATMRGEYVPMTAEQAYQLANTNKDQWVEIGMNPVRHSYFYDKDTQTPVVSAEEVVQVGGMVLAKNPVFGKREDYLYARRVEMGRAGMEPSAVEARLQELGFPTGGIIRVVNKPNADFEGRTIILDGKVTGIELNAAAMRDNATIDRVLNHEFAESANADGALNKLVERLTPKEKKEINDTITRLRYEERARTSEEAARTIETLAEAWKGRGFFTRAVARVEAWASKLGFKLTRRAAEYIAARNLADINSGFRTAYNQFINVKGEAREGRAFVTPEENARFLELAKDPEANREELQKMVDEAAKKAGFSVFDWWHGTKKDFNTFKATRYDDGLIFFSSKRDFSERWARNRKPNEKILERIESVRRESRDLVENLFKADGRFDLKREITEDTPEMREAAEKYLEAGREFERSKLDGMTWVEAEREMGVRIIHAYLGANRIFDPSKDWREVLPAILKRFGVKSESEIDKQSMDMLLKGNYIIWEEKALTDAVFEKFDAMMIQEDSDGPMNTIAVRDPSLIKMADPVTYDDQGNVIPLEQRFQPTTPDIRYARREVRESRREPEAIPTFTEGTPEAATLKEMEASMAKVDAASEAKGGKPETYKISEIASVWMDSGLGERELQDAIVEYTNLTPANAARVAKAIARQYDIQQSIATAFLETQTGLSVEALPEGVTLPKEVDPDRPKPVMQRLFDVFMGVRVPPVKIEVNEKTALKQQIRLKAAANRAAKAEQKRTAEEVVEIIKAMELLGPVRPKQVQALAKRAARVIWTSEKSVEAFSEYAAKVVENANYDADLREAKDAQKRAKQLSKQKKVAMSPQRQILEDVGKIPVNKLDDPRMFAEAVNYYLRGFKDVLSPDYVVIPDAEMESYLSGAQSETQRNQRDLDREANKRLAEKYGIDPDLVNEMMESFDILRQIEAQENREALENLLTEKAVETQQGLRGYDTDNLSAEQRPIVAAMLKIDPKALDSEERQRFIRITNNIIYNNQTNGSEYFLAVAKGQQSAREAAQDSTTIAKNRAWINLLPRFISERMQRGWALELQSVADTFRNAFGKGAMAKMYDAIGMLDLNLGFTKANNVIDEIQEKIAEFHRNLEKKYKAAARNQDGLLAEGVVGFLIQSVPKKDEVSSINQRRDLIKQDIANRKAATMEPDRVAMANRIEAILNRVDGESVEAILKNMKREFPANHESLVWYKDTLLPQYKDFLKSFDENFNDQANNYENPNYLTIGFTSAGPSLAITPEEQSLFYDQVSLRPKQSAYTIKRVDYTTLPTDRTTGKPKEIEFNLRRNVFNGLSDQINKAYTSSGWQRIASFMKTPEAEIVFGGAANKDFFIERLNRLRLSRMRRGSMGSGGAIEKAVDSLSVISRKLGTGIALGGIYQWIKQPPDQLITALGSGGRYDLLAKNIAPSTQKAARELLNKFSIGRRGDASSGYKYINQMEGHQNRLERYFSESKWDQVKEQAGKVADVWMVALKSSDFLAASAAWMTYYEGELNKQDIKIDDWSKEAALIESDPKRRQAAAFAEQMTDIYQGSSDPTSMATFAQSGKTGWENLVKAIFVPFNSFAIQQRMRLYSDARDVLNGSAGGKGGLAGTIGGLILFHATKRYAIPAISGAGIAVLYGLMGVDMEEPDEEKQKEEANKNWRQFLADITGNLLVGGTPQIVESQFIDAMNRASYLVSLQLENDSIFNDEGEIMSYDQYSKERSPFYRYKSFDNAMSLGMLDIGLGQAEQVALQTKMLATPEEMEMYTPEEQRLLYFSALSEWLYLMRLNDADFARLVSKARRDMIKAAEEREKEIKRIREGR